MHVEFRQRGRRENYTGEAGGEKYQSRYGYFQDLKECVL